MGAPLIPFLLRLIDDALKLDKEPMIKTVAGAVKNGRTTHSSSVTVSTVIPSALAQDNKHCTCSDIANCDSSLVT